MDEDFGNPVEITYDYDVTVVKTTALELALKYASLINVSPDEVLEIAKKFETYLMGY